MLHRCCHQSLGSALYLVNPIEFLDTLTLIKARATLDADVFHFCDGSFQQDCRGSATVSNLVIVLESSRDHVNAAALASYRRSRRCSVSITLQLFPARHLDLRPRSHHVVIFTLSPDPRTRSIRNLSAWVWTSPSVCAVETYYHMKTLQWSLPQRSKRESVGKPRRPAGALNLK